MLKVIIIEDEINNQELLQSMLLDYCKGVEILGIADNVKTGIKLLNDANPDLVFLDVELPDGNGFDILSNFDNPKFKVVFVTGYDHYAIKAIKYAALDYLVKPINLEELRISLVKANEYNESQVAKLHFLNNAVSKKSIDQLLISDSKTHKILRFDQILYIKADRTYVCFYTVDNSSHIASHPLSYYEGILPVHMFYRIHKSIIINCSMIHHIETGRSGSVVMNNKISLPIAVRRKASFLSFIKNIK